MNTILRTAVISDIDMQSDQKVKGSEKNSLKGLDFGKLLSSLKEKGKTSKELKKTIKNALQNMSDKEGEEILNKLKALIKQGDNLSKLTLKKIRDLLSGIDDGEDSKNKLLKKFMKVIEDIDVDNKKNIDTSSLDNIKNDQDIDVKDLEIIVENLEKIGELLEKITDGKVKLKVEVEDPDKNDVKEDLISKIFNGDKDNERIKEGKEGKEQKVKNNNIKETSKKVDLIDDLFSENADEVATEISNEDVPNRVLKALKEKIKENVKETVEVKDEGLQIKETIKVIEKELISKEGNKTILKTTIIVERMKDNDPMQNDLEKFMRFSNNVNLDSSTESSEKNIFENMDNLKGNLKTYSPGEVVQHLTQRVKYADVDGKQIMTMNLRPGELGQVKVLISRIDGKMDIRIMTEHGEAKNALMANAGELKANLKSEGVNLNAFEIIVNPDGKNGQDQERQEKNNEKNKKNRQKAKTINFQDVIRAFGPIQRRDVNVNV